MKATLVFSAIVLIACANVAAQIDQVTVLQSFPATTDTGDKPQSKVWSQGGNWWAVMSTDTETPAGSWIYRLEPDDSWAAIYRISSSTTARADTLAVGDVTHVLLHDTATELYSLEHVAAGNTYQPWSSRTTGTPIALPECEAPTIDIDSTGRMWLATNRRVGNTWEVVAHYSDPPYSTFTGPIVLAPSITSDDIATVIALPNGTIGVLWSNQREFSRQFGFRIHVDGVDPTVWLADEEPVALLVMTSGLGVADDHINMAVGADSTLYAAIKTESSGDAIPELGLLVRRSVGGGPTGVWDDLYEVDMEGTRPIVILNEGADRLQVIFTGGEDLPFDHILARESRMSEIDFGLRRTLSACGLNNPTSTKQNWTDEVPVLSSDGSNTEGVLLRRDTEFGAHWEMNEGGGVELLDATGNGNAGATVGDPTWVQGIHDTALELDGTQRVIVADDASLDLSGTLSLSAWVQPQALADQQIVSKGAALDGYSLFLDAGGFVSVRFNGSEGLRVDSSTPYGLNQWMHVAATYDETTIRLYIDGEENASLVAAFGVGSQDEVLSIGAGPNGEDPLTGLLDEVRIYDRVLSPVEVRLQSVAGPVPGGPVGLWQFDESDGQRRFFDLSGHANHGDLARSPGHVPGVHGSALDLDGSGEHAVVPNSPTLDITGAITLSVWMRPETIGTQRVIRKLTASTDTGYALFLSANEFVSVKFNDDNSYRVDTSTLYSDRLGQWMHVVATYDGSVIRLYVDGREEDSRATGFAIESNLADVRIGADVGCGTAFEGALDEARIYDRAISAAEVQELFCPAPELPTVIFGAERQPGGDPLLSIDDPNLPGEVQRFNVYRSSDPTLAYELWPLAAAEIVDEEPGSPGLQWTDDTGDVSPTGGWYYRVAGCAAPSVP